MSCWVYGGTAIIAGKDKTQVQQKRYRYTGKERDDSSGLCHYGARYLAPWLTWNNFNMSCWVNILKGIIVHINIQHFPESYERLENIVRTYPANKLNLLNANTKFSIISDDSSNRESIIQAHTRPSYDSFKNTMNFSIGELVFNSNFKNENPNLRSGLNATEVTSYQYLGMTKIAGALNMLPTTMLRYHTKIWIFIFKI
jgi:hypothetical protein